MMKKSYVGLTIMLLLCLVGTSVYGEELEWKTYEKTAGKRFIMPQTLAAAQNTIRSLVDILNQSDRSIDALEGRIQVQEQRIRVKDKTIDILEQNQCP